MKVKDKKSKNKKKQPTTRAERKPKNPAQLPVKFTPKWLKNVDGRQSAIKEVKRRLEKLKADCGCDSFQKELLCERAVHIATLLQSQEIASYQNEKFDQGSYTQMVNCLIGLLKSLGLNKQAGKVIDLKTYLIQSSEEKAKDAEHS